MAHRDFEKNLQPQNLFILNRHTTRGSSKLIDLEVYPGKSGVETPVVKSRRVDLEPLLSVHKSKIRFQRYKILFFNLSSGVHPKEVKENRSPTQQSPNLKSF